MEYVFGSTLVCDTLDNAKRVAFDKRVMTKTVTLGGDVFDPQGTLSGGETHDSDEDRSSTIVSFCSLPIPLSVSPPSSNLFPVSLYVVMCLSPSRSQSV